MPEAQTELRNFDLSKGLNTELHDLAWPLGFTKDETNYELLSDGTRRRRKGLAVEASAGSAQTVLTIVATQVHQSYKWKNVGGDPDKAFIVHQIGQFLYFTDDDTIPSNSWHVDTVDVEAFGAEASVTTANIRDNAVRFAQGRGHLFVTGPYLKPFYVSYNATLDDITPTEIPISYRDFEGIDDGVSVTTEPTGTITADHRYNLRNRGWPQADLTTVFSDLSKHPGKNGIWWRAYERQRDTTTDTTKVEVTGTHFLDTPKYDAEVFGQSTAPLGSLFLDPFDTRFANDLAGSGVVQLISTWTRTEPDGAVLTVTVTGHGFSNGDSITVSGQLSRYLMINVRDWDFNGSYTIANKTTNTFEITVAPPHNFVAWDDQYKQLGQIGAGVSLAKSDGALVERGFQAIGFYAGRVWYAGLADSQFADHVFFSRIVQKESVYGQCHQLQNPTDEDFNALTPADGGVLIVPGMNGVVDMLNIGNSLVLVGTQGAWEVAGGGRSVFTATSFNVRQLTAANFNSPTGSISLEDSGIAVGPSGIYQIGPNEFTGLLEAKNMIENTILTKWNQFSTSEQLHCQTIYDDAKRRVYFMLGGDSTSTKYTEMLIYDIKHTAWFRYTFAPAASFGLLSMVAISDADTSDSNQKMKFLYQASGTTVQFADFEQTDFLDFDALEAPLPFMVTGFDNLGDFQRRKQAPIITVFQKRTETGFNTELDTALNISSTLMTAFWDWTEAIEWDNPTTPTAQRAWTGTVDNHGISGKIGFQSEVYRHVRGFVPLATSDVDGYPTVVTRNKVRGRGRVLQLRFDGAATFDSHIIGWQTNYKVSKRP